MTQTDNVIEFPMQDRVRQKKIIDIIDRAAAQPVGMDAAMMVVTLSNLIHDMIKLGGRDWAKDALVLEAFLQGLLVEKD